MCIYYCGFFRKNTALQLPRNWTWLAKACRSLLHGKTLVAHKRSYISAIFHFHVDHYSCVWCKHEKHAHVENSCTPGVSKLRPVTPFCQNVKIYLRKICWFGIMSHILKQSHYSRCPVLELLCMISCGPRKKKFGDPCFKQWRFDPRK